LSKRKILFSQPYFIALFLNMKTTENNHFIPLWQEETRQNRTLSSLLWKRTQRKAFTLVELIIVITILAILATIAFMSFQGYTRQSRDANRVSTMKNIEKGLSIFFTKSWIYPQTESGMLITASGTTIGYQWFVWDGVVRAINMNQVPLDPEDNTRYLYSTNEKKTKYQLMAFMEWEANLVSLLPQSFASDMSKRYPSTIWDNLGIVLNEDNSLITGTWIEIVNNSNRYKAIINNQIVVSWTGGNLRILSARDQNNSLTYAKSCKEIMDNWFSKGDGKYWINPTGTGSFQVYCDMTSEGGGWTLVANWSTLQTDNMFPWNSELAKNYSYGTYSATWEHNSNYYLNYSSFDFKDILFLSWNQKYECWFDYNQLIALKNIEKWEPNITVKYAKNTIKRVWEQVNVLRRSVQPEDPWVGCAGNHYENSNVYSMIFWGENNSNVTSFSWKHHILAKENNGIWVFIR